MREKASCSMNCLGVGGRGGGGVGGGGPIAIRGDSNVWYPVKSGGEPNNGLLWLLMAIRKKIRLGRRGWRRG